MLLATFSGLPFRVLYTPIDKVLVYDYTYVFKFHVSSLPLSGLFLVVRLKQDF